MATRRGRNAEREARWRAVVARCAASGLSVREFCRREGIAEPAFYAWRRTIAARDAAAESSARGETSGSEASSRVAAGPPAFLPMGQVTAAGAAMAGVTASVAGGGFALELRGGRTLRMPASLSARRLAAIVRALESEVSP